MESNKEEAFRAKEIADKRFTERDFVGAKQYALKAQALYPGLEGISQMVATVDVYIASEVKVNGETDYYSILGLNPSADKSKVKKQYRKMAVLLHPDKNKSLGADGAFKLVSEAWTLLSDGAKRSSYDLRRNKQLSSGIVQTNLSSVHTTAGVKGFDNCYKSPMPHQRLDTFWTVCTSCKVQYEYLRKYLNKRLSCKNCRGTFMAVETGAAPVNGSFPYSPWSYSPGNGYGSHGSHGFNGVTYFPTNTVFYPGNGVSGFHSGHGSEYVPNVSLQWSSISGTSAGVVDPNGSSNTCTKPVYQANGKVSRRGNKVKMAASDKHVGVKTVAVNVGPNVSTACNGPSASKAGRPDKKRKVDLGGTSKNGYEETGLKTTLDARLANGNAHIGPNPKLSNSAEQPTRRCSVAPAFDARKLLMDKARAEIRKKLEEMRLASAAAAVAAAAAAAAAEKNTEVNAEVHKSEEAPKTADLGVSDHQSAPNKTPSLSITVPDPDFHDFDKDRSEECFKPKQIWALYDEEDGMPRLYCLIRQVISIEPFKIHITYLNSKTDSEFGSVNWIDSGFTKSCGNFKAWNSDVVDQVNIFSHLLSGEKAGRGGCVRIYPKSGDIWAVYRNWSPNWNRSTPYEVRHQYEMVEVLDDYSEELGVCVAPLIKLEGFKTVYQKNASKNAVRWIPRREMLRFSHRVPSCLLKGEASNLPDGCWDLDPAATPDELLNAAKEEKIEHKPSQAENQDLVI